MSIASARFYFLKGPVGVSLEKKDEPTGQVAAPIKPYENRRGAFARTGRKARKLKVRCA
jgi:hypothetical protein